MEDVISKDEIIFDDVNIKGSPTKSMKLEDVGEKKVDARTLPH